jgi:hypothetical protein
MKRRTLLRSALALPLAGALPSSAGEPAPFIDCNIWLGQHPNRDLPWHDTATIAKNLKLRGVTEAWACTFDAILHKDLAAANAELTRECASTSGHILPVGAINPLLPDWQDDVRDCATVHHMHAIRLLPAYHGYKLDDPVFAEVLALAEKHKLLVQIVTQMEDQRTQHPLLQVPDVDLKPLAKDARVMVLNANASHVLTGLRGKKAVIDTAFIEGVGGIENQLKSWPLDQLVFGSHTPWFYFDANRLKLQESELSAEQHAAITSRNALAMRTATR